MSPADRFIRAGQTGKLAYQFDPLAVCYMPLTEGSLETKRNDTVKPSNW